MWICIHGKKLPSPKHFWIDPLLRIRDAYPKLLIARIYQPAWQHDGIRVINAAEWMADGLVRILVDGDYTELCKTSLEDAVNAFETVDEQ